MARDIPLFRENLAGKSIDVVGKGIVSGSGTMAQAESFGMGAKFMKDVSDFSAGIYEQQQVARVERGEFSAEQLPPPVTVIGAKMRDAFVKTQAIDTNIQITNKVREITQNQNLSIEGMQEALRTSAEAMVEANIPEMSDTIRQNFGSAGIGAIEQEANRRVVQQRAALQESTKIQTDFWKEEYVRSFGASKRTEQQAIDLQVKVLGNELSEEEYIDAYEELDKTADQRAATAQANLVKTVNAKVEAGLITPEVAEIELAEIAKEARQEYLAFSALEDGLQVLDKTDLSFDEQIEIATKATTLAGMRNAEFERSEKEERELFQREYQGDLQQARNLALFGDTNSAKEIVGELSRRNEAIGDKDLMAQLKTVTEDIDFIAASGGAPNPEAFGYYKREIQAGRIGDERALLDDAKDNGRKLNAQEVTDLVQETVKVQGSVLNNPIFQNNLKLIKLRLPNDPDWSEMGTLLSGGKKSATQKMIEAARANIEDELRTGVLDGSLASPQQQKDFLEREVKTAKEVLRPEFKKIFDDYGLNVNSTKEEIVEKIKVKFPAPDGFVGTTPEAEAELFKLLKKQKQMKEVLGE